MGRRVTNPFAAVAMMALAAADERLPANARPALPDGGLFIAGHGYAAKLDADLPVVEAVAWNDPGFFEYAQAVVGDDAVWLLVRRGRLRFQFTETAVLRVPIAPQLAAPTVVRTDPGTTGGALVRLGDGTVRSVLSTETGEVRIERL